MSLEETNCVDALGIESKTGYAVLTLADSWEWVDEHAHLLALQAKLNGYFEFIETGQIWEAYPAAQGRQLVIDVVTRFPPPEAGQSLLKKARDVAVQLNILVRHRVYTDGVGSKNSDEGKVL